MAERTASSKACTKVLRVLALHGYWQNAHSFRERSGNLRQKLKKRAEIVIISAPLTVPEPGEEGDFRREDPRGWWFSDHEKKSFNAMVKPESCVGLEESLDAVAKAFSELGPFDGILGFSQGAAVVAMLCALKQQGDPRFQFDFAILFAGFKSRASEHAHFYKEPIIVPSLHVFGDTDRVIPGDMSQELAAHFVNPVLVTHPGGHYMPVCAAQKNLYLSFLDSFRK